MSQESAACAHCSEPRRGPEFIGAPCECGSGLCDACCCGWDCLCHHCGSHDHETDRGDCAEGEAPATRYGAHAEWLARAKDA